MRDFLAEMAAKSLERCEAARVAVPYADLLAAARDSQPALPLKLSGFDVIAEVKRASPSEGAFRIASGDGDDARGHLAQLIEQTEAYQAGGACAISVLTEPSAFHGSLHDLAVVASDSQVPVMRKDFLVDVYQVAEARSRLASGVLLITRILEDAKLVEMVTVARDLGMFVIVEGFDEVDIDRAERLLGADHPGVLMGLNCRNLTDLSIDLMRFGRLRHHFRGTSPAIAESGMQNVADVHGVAALGYDLALVGSSLMKSPAPAGLLGEMIAAGRAARAASGRGGA